jgi:hypothetical protein
VPPGGLRLTRRGRLLLTTSCVALALGSGLIAPWGSSVGASTTAPDTASASAAPGPTTARVTVSQGHTLWEIARTIAPRTDPRVTIERIRDLNGLPDSSVRAGQEIVVPVT